MMCCVAEGHEILALANLRPGKGSNGKYWFVVVFLSNYLKVILNLKNMLKKNKTFTNSVFKSDKLLLGYYFNKNCPFM